MLEIGKNTIVSLDLIERYFHCDLDDCLGECCIEGDAGAPLTREEADRLQELLPRILPYLNEKARKVVLEEGVSYIDEEGDLVTQLVDGANCVFTTFGSNGVCLCALEKARREGETDFFKPISCALYPVRVKEYDGFTAVNYHRWKICKGAEVMGRAKGVRAYEFLREPLTRRFGREWYDELAFTAEEYLRQTGK
ncbi:MAG: DUF3109 family protein [Muribaculaceae bacterium]|nr:DUF3109 family protein [Muribaculaceae bacterium]MDE5957402.1 DUF3109 family protein [Muribaculaceae bacterium]MDE6447310.1 DUF3109 family protein [Muribaculaceae bacterium]MDE7342586.1 DUF3109 family protein [Muribaculaceae bacterium]